MQADKTDKQSDSSSLTRFFAIIIANPASGSGGLPHHAHHLHETLTFLRAHGWQADLWYTHAVGEGEQLARKAVELKANLVIAAGGDGTINEIIQGLAGSETALGVLPNGTVNVWARELGIPLDEAWARDLLGRMVVLWDFLLRREQRRLWVRYDTFTSIKIETLRPVAYHIDGEVAGYTPATFQVAPAALKVIVPQKTPEGLFSKE